MANRINFYFAEMKPERTRKMTQTFKEACRGLPKDCQVRSVRRNQLCSPVTERHTLNLAQLRHASSEASVPCLLNAIPAQVLKADACASDFVVVLMTSIRRAMAQTFRTSDGKNMFGKVKHSTSSRFGTFGTASKEQATLFLPYLRD